MEHAKNALALLNGERPPQALLEEFWGKADLRICADGAARILYEHRLRPDVILGDLDSFPYELREYFDSVPLIHIPDQNSTDGEKALHYCAERGFARIEVLGALGKRTDHALYNLGLLNKKDFRDLEITFHTKEDKIFLIRKKRTFFEEPGTIISLAPIFGQVEKVSSEGLLYPLKEATLKMGAHSSVSNEFVGETASVDLSAGELLVIIERKS